MGEDPTIVVIQGEAIETWPARCPRPTRNCATCVLEGKIQCDARFWPSGREGADVADVTDDMTTEAPTKRVAVPRRKRPNTKEKHKYIEAHKAEIIADVITLGVDEALKRWDLSKGAWSNARFRWRDDLVKAGYDAYWRLRSKNREKPASPRGVSMREPKTAFESVWFKRGWAACRRHFMEKFKEVFLEK